MGASRICFEPRLHLEIFKPLRFEKKKIPHKNGIEYSFTSKIQPARYLQVGNFETGFTTSSKFLFLVVLSALIDLETWWYCSRNRPETEPFAAVAVHIRYRYTIQPVYSVISVYRGKLCWQKRTMFIKAYIHLRPTCRVATNNFFYRIRNRKVLPLKRLISHCRHFQYLNGYIKGSSVWICLRAIQ